MNRNIFCVTAPLWMEFTGHRWFPLTRAIWDNGLALSGYESLSLSKPMTVTSLLTHIHIYIVTYICVTQWLRYLEVLIYFCLHMLYAPRNIWYTTIFHLIYMYQEINSIELKTNQNKNTFYLLHIPLPSVMEACPNCPCRWTGKR